MVAGARYGVDLRGATPADTTDLARLMTQLGYPMDARAAAHRLDAVLAAPDNAVLVATGFDGTVIGLVALHWCAMLQQQRPVARITALVVDDQESRRGIGRMLVKGAAQAARSAGCDVLELTTGLQREDAHAFYRAIGFTESARRFSRGLRKRSTVA